MEHQVVSATEFKAKCLSLLDQVEQTGGSITITKRGRPVAEVRPAKKRKWRNLMGCMAGGPDEIVEVEDLAKIDTSDLWDVVSDPDRCL